MDGIVEWLIGWVTWPFSLFAEAKKVNEGNGAITKANVIGSLLCAAIAAGGWWLWASIPLTAFFGVATIIVFFMNQEVFGMVSKMGIYAAIAAPIGAAIAGCALAASAPFYEVWMGAGMVTFIGLAVTKGL